MVRQYGGVNNKQSIDEMQEATIVNAPIFRKKQPKSKSGVIGGWIAYWVISWLITTLLIVATGLYEQMNKANIPMVMGFFIIPSIPFLSTLIWSAFKFKKISKQKDAGD